MEKKLNYASIIKRILGDEIYFKLLLKVTKETEQNNIDLVNYFDKIFNMHCLIILLLATSKKAITNAFKLKIKDNIIKVDNKEFASKYKKYIKTIENKEFKIIEIIL